MLNGNHGAKLVWMNIMRIVTYASGILVLQHTDPISVAAHRSNYTELHKQAVTTTKADASVFKGDN